MKTGAAEIQVSGGLISALSWLQYEMSEKHIQSLLAAESPIARRAGIAAAAIHRQNPPRALTDALVDSDPLLKARALRAVDELGLVDLHPTVRKSLNATDEGSRFCGSARHSMVWGTAWSLMTGKGGVHSLGPAGGPGPRRKCRGAPQGHVACASANSSG